METIWNMMRIVTAELDRGLWNHSREEMTNKVLIRDTSGINSSVDVRDGQRGCIINRWLGKKKSIDGLGRIGGAWDEWNEGV